MEHLHAGRVCFNWNSRVKGQTSAGMAEYDDGGVDMNYGEGVGLGGVGGMSSDEEYETMTAAEVLEKLEEV